MWRSGLEGDGREVGHPLCSTLCQLGACGIIKPQEDMKISEE